MKYRIKMAKSSLNLSKTTSSTQNADLLEALLLAFEEKVERSLLANQLSSSGFSSSSSESSFVSNTRCYFNSKIANVSRFWCSRTSHQGSSQSAPESSPPVFQPQKFQISTQATGGQNLGPGPWATLWATLFWWFYIFTVILSTWWFLIICTIFISV